MISEVQEHLAEPAPEFTVVGITERRRTADALEARREAEAAKLAKSVEGDRGGKSW